MTGYIFDHRKELESDVWLLPPMYHRVWQWIKYMVNHTEAKIPNKDGSYTIIKPGQHATSYRHIAKGVGYYEGLKWKEPNPKTIKIILDWLRNQKMIDVKGNTNGTIITVLNWELYQKEIVKGNAKVTLEKHLLDTNKNDKEELRKTTCKKSDYSSIRKLFPGTKTKAAAMNKLPKIVKEYGEEQIIRTVERYIQFVNNKRKNEQPNLQYMNESTFWNGRYMDFLDSEYQDVKTKEAPREPYKGLVIDHV